MTLLETLCRRKLLVVTGKGGVGKSTLAATLGQVLARAGRRGLVLEIDPRESLYQLFEVPPSGGESVRVAPGLYVQNLRPRAVVDALVRAHLHLGFLANRVLSSTVYEHFVEGAPGLKELAVLDYAMRMATGAPGEGEPDVDVVLLDAPATGHGVSLLAAPLLVADVIHDGPIGRMAGEIAEFVSDAARCGIVVATLAEEMPVQETIETIRTIEGRLDRTPDVIVVNGLYPEGAARREVNDRELRRLATGWTGPRIDLPMLPLGRGPGLLDSLGQRLEAGLAGTA